MSEHNTFWQTKLHARLHDPAEKALVLLRDPEGHEGGTSRALHRLAGYHELPVSDWLDPDNADVLSRVLFSKGIPTPMYETVRRADWWAAAADRPQWPMRELTVSTANGSPKTLAVADFAQVRWTRKPEIIHPLTGQSFDLGSLGETDVETIKTKSFSHFERLVVRDQDGAFDFRRTHAAFWRFGPELLGEGSLLDAADDDTRDHDTGELGLLWPHLPADTRVPDHSIWDHLDLTSAFAGAFAADPDGDAALLAVSLGPVQDFIASARKTEDLWAGSHLLSRLAWEAMRVICETLGPDAMVFPRLRGVPQVDVWLRDDLGLGGSLDDDWFGRHCPWTFRQTDANPLFTAALPNRFVAIVPASQARELAEQARDAARKWLDDTGVAVVSRLLKEANMDVEAEAETVPYAQMKAQLEGFPEVHWAAVPFSLIRPRDQQKQRDLDTTALQAAMAPFFGCDPDAFAGFLDTPAWQVLRDDIDWDGTHFFAPNPGVLYPAVHDLVERLLAASKGVRAFRSSPQEGYRDSLSGEAEWLTTDLDQLALPPGQRRDTLWTRIHANRPAWAREGEHLGGLSAIKRLWPTVFAEQVGRTVAEKDDGRISPVGRFVVSTHTMALAHQLDRWLESGADASASVQREFGYQGERVALPRRLVERHRGHPQWQMASQLPGYLQEMQESDNPEDWRAGQDTVRDALADGTTRPGIETYYAMLLMDGDRMGAILSGDPESDVGIRYEDGFHSQVREGFHHHAQGNPRLLDYAQQPRALSPGRHFAISGALNDFALKIVPHVLEREHLGKLIYAGGDDVLAMLPVADALGCARRLRYAWSGHDDRDETFSWTDIRNRRAGQRGWGRQELFCRDGFAHLRGQLLRMMGPNATMSAGIVIAHHQAPLEAVRRALHAAEQHAKNEGGRDAFSITLIKRAGATTHFTARFDVLGTLDRTVEYLREPAVSRRAVYSTLEWLKDLPDPVPHEMLGSLLDWQLRRQCGRKSVWQLHDVPGLAHDLAHCACGEKAPREWLRDLLLTAEFLAREIRSKPPGTESSPQDHTDTDPDGKGETAA